MVSLVIIMIKSIAKTRYDKKIKTKIGIVQH